MEKKQEVLYLSALCSIKEYERMFQRYKTTSSHASQKFHRMICNGLVENGCAVETLSVRVIRNSQRADLSKEDECENDIKYHYLKRWPNYKLNQLYSIVQSVAFLLKWKKRHPDGIIICDIIAGELSMAQSIAKWFDKSLISIGLVTDVPNVRAGDERKGIRDIPRRIKNSLIANYDGYIFLTEEMNCLLNKKHMPYTVIEGLVDQTVLEKKNTLEGKNKFKECMMAGLLENVFGVDILLKAFMKVRNPDARLVFYGKGSAVEEIKKAGDIDPRISFRGEVTNQQIVEEERKATLLINPRQALEEWTKYSFPSKNMEYMASGTPLVGYRLPCIPNEYLEYFYVVERDDVDYLSVFLEKLLSQNEDQIHEFGLRAQEWIVKNKNERNQTSKIVLLIDHMKGGTKKNA